MKLIKTTIFVICAMLLSACGTTPQQNVTLQSNMINAEKKVGIFVKKLDIATTNIYGASCLLCYGVASAANAELDKHLKTLPITDLESSKSILVNGYKTKANSVEFVEISEQELKKLKKFKGEQGFAKTDFRTLKESKNIDVLVVLEYSEHGAYRSYNAYVPTSDPQGYVKGLVYSVDLESNQYLQYLSLDHKVIVEGEWDEPKEQFPGVTNAYFQAVENAKESLKKIFL